MSTPVLSGQAMPGTRAVSAVMFGVATTAHFPPWFSTITHWLGCVKTGPTW